LSNNRSLIRSQLLEEIPGSAGELDPWSTLLMPLTQKKTVSIVFRLLWLIRTIVSTWARSSADIFQGILSCDMHMGGNESHHSLTTLENGRWDSFFVNVVWDSILPRVSWHVLILPSTRRTVIERSKKQRIGAEKVIAPDTKEPKFQVGFTFIVIRLGSKYLCSQ
jgi:hypothetical protein